MRVLIIANSCSGTYHFRKELIEALSDRGDEVIVSVPEDELLEDFRKVNCHLVLNNTMDRRGTNPIKDIALYKYYKELLGKISPDVVVSFTIKPNVYGGLAAGGEKKPYVSCVTGLGTAIENEGPLKKVALAMYKAGLRKANRVFFENTADRDFMVANGVVKEEKTHVVNGAGVNISAHPYEDYPPEDGGVVFTMVGRMMRDKGTNEYLEAAEAIKKTHPNTIFQIVGEYDEDYEDIIQKAEKDGIVRFLGYTKDVHSVMKKSHAIVHPSYHEGMSNVLLEAASTGRPVIASNIPGCREAFDEGKSGIEFKPKSVADLVRALEVFMTLSHDKRKEMGKNGRTKMEREFDRKIIVNEYLKEIDRANGTV